MTMPNNNKFFITKSNFKKIVFKTKLNIDQNISKIFESIYSDINLRPYINDKEASTIKKTIDFLECSEEFLLNIKDDTIKGKTNFSSNSNFIFVSVSSPKYHKNSSCETLSNDFENFEIPSEIMERGKDEIKKFREFANKNKKLLKDDKEDVFIFKLTYEFKLTTHINKILFNNSGYVDLYKQSEKDIEVKIKETIEKIESFRETEEGRNAIRGYIYSSVRNTENLKPLEKELLLYKRLLIDLVMQFNVNKFKNENEDITFSEKLLEFYGFQKCAMCFPEKIEFNL